MKKMIVLILAAVLLCSVAYADISSDFIENWNKAAHIYGAPELSKDDMLQETDEFGWFVESEWVIAMTYVPGEIMEANVATVSGDDLLKLSVMAGVTVNQNKSSETLQRYLGNILTMYLRIISDQNSRHAVFGDYEYSMEKKDGLFWFSMVKN